MTFRNRLLLFTVGWFLASAAILTVLSFAVWEENALCARQTLHRDLAVHMRDDNPLMVGDDYSPEALSSIFHTLMLLGPDFEIYFLDPSGNITTSGPPISAVQRHQIDTAPIKQFLAGDDFPILGPDPLSSAGDSVFSVAPITLHGTLAGYLYVVIGSQHDSAIFGHQALLQYAPMVLGALVVILSFALLVYSMVYRHIITPGRNMVRQIEQSAENEFRVSPPLNFHSPELHEMAQQCRRMLIVIQQQFVQLRLQEAQRREYMVQLNHDLKTPLANILGYIETWQMQHEEGRALIDTAHHNAKRLQQQLQLQLEAARSPSVRLVLSYQELDVESMLREVKQRFELESNKKQQQIEVRVSGSLFVLADEQLIQRVFDNLLENAVRHCPPTGTVTLNAEASAPGKVRFTVTNPIDAKSQSGALGMGGKIVDAILSLHQTKIEVGLVEGTPLRYRAIFSLAQASSASPRTLASLSESLQQEGPRLDSDYPAVSAVVETARQDEPNMDDGLHLYAKETAASKETLPSFSALTAKGQTEQNKKP